MNCQEVWNRLDDYVDEYSPPMERAAIELHIRACRNCTEALARERELRRRLRALPAPEPDLALFSRTIAAAADAEERRLRRHRWRTAGGALAAAVVLALGLGMDGDTPPEQRLASVDTAPVPAAMPTVTMQAVAPVQAVTVVLDQESEISLALESGRRIEEATFTVELPEGVELSGYPGVREITWTGHLESGKNLLVLPIKVFQSGNGGELVAHIADGQVERRRSLTLRMDVVPPATAPSRPSVPSPEAITVM